MHAHRKALQHRIGRVDLVEPGHDDLCNAVRNERGLAKSASSPRSAAARAAARATPATATTSAAPATSATAAAAPGYLDAAANVFLVEEMERCQADISDFFVAESDGLSRYIVGSLLHVRARHGRCRCASHQR
jgi:hypothetical protein